MADRQYIRTVTQFITQPQYSNVVPMLSILNEPMANPSAGTNGTGQAAMEAFYAQAYSAIREITGSGAGKGPMIAIGDAFLGGTNWVGWLPNADRVAMDLHSYLVFAGTQRAGTIASFGVQACNQYSASTRTLMQNFGFTSHGEWSLAINDCGQYVNGVTRGSQFDGTQQGSSTVYGSCNDWTDATTWNAAKKQQFQQLASAWLDATQNSFFWTWKIGPNLAGKIPSPMWSMQLAIESGYWPTNMRNNTCDCDRPSLTHAAALALACRARTAQRPSLVLFLPQRPATVLPSMPTPLLRSPGRHRCRRLARRCTRARAI